MEQEEVAWVKIFWGLKHYPFGIEVFHIILSRYILQEFNKNLGQKNFQEYGHVYIQTHLGFYNHGTKISGLHDVSA